MRASGAEVRIRRMTPGDLDRVMEIARGLKDAPQWTASAYISAMNPEGAQRRIALVATEPEAPSRAVLGFAVASLLAPEAELETIAVAVEGQRCGVGMRLFAALAEELSAVQVTNLYLEVRSSNGPALAFYHALGFKESGRRPLYYSDPVEDALLLQLRLPAIQAK
jgi:[ribosomal protein S18]-alanine N-acetyltransferase